MKGEAEGRRNKEEGRRNNDKSGRVRDPEKAVETMGKCMCVHWVLPITTMMSCSMTRRSTCTGNHLEGMICDIMCHAEMLGT